MTTQARTPKVAGEGRRLPRQGDARRKGEPLGYLFDPTPKALTDAIAVDLALPPPPEQPPPGWEPRAWGLERRRIFNDRLRAMDALVADVILRFDRPIRHLAWCSVETIAEKTGLKRRSVQSSLRRLSLPRPGFAPDGFIRQEPTEKPDPDDPRNRKIGWRFVLVWLAPPGYPVKGGPDRRPNEARKVWSRSDGPGVQPVAPSLPFFDAPVAPETAQGVAPSPVSPVAPNYAGASACPDGIEPDGEENPPSSSSGSAPAEPVAPPPVRTDDDEEEFAARQGEGNPGGLSSADVDAVREALGETVAGQVEAHGAAVAGLLGDGGALVEGAKRTRAEGDRKADTGERCIGDVLLYALVIALGHKGDPGAKEKAKAFLRGKGLNLVSSEECRRELEKARSNSFVEFLTTKLAEDEARDAPRRAAEEARAKTLSPDPGTREDVAKGIVDRYRRDGYTVHATPNDRLCFWVWRDGKQVTHLTEDQKAEILPFRAEVLAFLKAEVERDTAVAAAGNSRPYSAGKPLNGGHR